MQSPCEKYHDHVANIYDDIYRRSPYWEFYHDLSWRHLKAWIPTDLSFKVHDVGCGTGIYGLKFLKAGFHVHFSDISAKMLHQAQRKVEEAGYIDRASFQKMDMADMTSIKSDTFGFICGQGDPLSLCGDPKKALKETARILQPGGIAALSVDNRPAGYEYYLEKQDLDGLIEFNKKGVLTWLAEKKDERFPCSTFDSTGLKKLAGSARLSVVSIIGKTVLPLRKHPKILEDPKAARILMKIERKLGAIESNFGKASHLQIILRKT